LKPPEADPGAGADEDPGAGADEDPGAAAGNLPPNNVGRLKSTRLSSRGGVPPLRAFFDGDVVCWEDVALLVHQVLVGPSGNSVDTGFFVPRVTIQGSVDVDVVVVVGN